MFDESKNNFVAVCGRLQSDHPEVYAAIEQACVEESVKFFGNGSLNIWIRDYALVQVGQRFFKFFYEYGTDNPRFKNLRVKPSDWNFLETHEHGEIPVRLDGGNIVRHGDQVVMTDIIFQHNPEWSRNSLVDYLEWILEGEITLIPTEPGDDIGHSDGAVHFAPDGDILVNDLANIRPAYFKKLVGALTKFNVHSLPCAHDQMPEITEREFRAKHPTADTFNPGYGYYINFTVIGNTVLLPVFGIESDDTAFKQLLKHFPKHKVKTVDCHALSMLGGLLNCVTVSYKI